MCSFYKNNNVCSALKPKCPTLQVPNPLLTCGRCLRYTVQRSDLPQLESGSHFMTAVGVHVDHIHRKYDRWQNPKESAGVHAWAYSSGHCRISNVVSLWIAYCSLTASCVTVLEIGGTEVQWSDDEFKHLTNVSVWFSHYWLGWVWALHSIGSGSSLEQRTSGLGEASLSLLQHFAVVGCLHACLPNLRTLPALSVYYSQVTQLKLTTMSL